jgi:putative oxidoreductase
VTLRDLRETHADKVAGVTRLVLGVLFIMTGLMKLVVPMLAAAWSGQLIAAGLPFYALTLWVVPFVEVGVGILLVLGLYARLAGLVALAIMVVATYVHIIVDDPALFPLQPSAPVIPLSVMVLVAYVIWKGAGSWSLDLEATGAAA